MAHPTTPEFSLVPLNRGGNGGHFLADGLRGQAVSLSPFLGVDHYWMSGPTFPPHSHSAMSAVSYLLQDSETGMSNRDSIGTENLIRPGGLHWTTAGRGVVHEEVPAEPGKSVHGLQIFVALPESDRNIAPFPLTIEADAVPVIHQPGVRIRIPVGRYAGQQSPLVPPTDVTILDITLEPDAHIEIPLPADEGLFAMPIRGAVEIQGERFASDDRSVPVFGERPSPRTLVLSAREGAAHVVLFSGRPFPLH
ncbi:pirin family protein [Stenotrophomonas sp. Ste96]|uniref:pirin family protein n=1 Tax=Stenotrophomonas sp. Ste96 TaxID=2926029 RepID=UPI0021C97CDF|nr:pirin family protein [Stenotrophomonas sp. Ste96]